MSLALRTGLSTRFPEPCVASVDVTASLAMLTASLTTLEKAGDTGSRQNERDFLTSLRAGGIDAWSYRDFKDPEVLRSIASDPGLHERVMQALRPEKPESKRIIPVPDQPSWHPEVQRHLDRRILPVWRAPALLDHWREVRAVRDTLEVPGTFSEQARAGLAWATVLEGHGLGKVVATSDVERTPMQFLRWLGVKAIPENRCLRALDSPWSLGFRELTKQEPVMAGDLITTRDPLLAGAAIVSGVLPSGSPAEVLFVLGGQVFVSHPSLVGERVTHWRREKQGCDAVIIGKSSFTDAAFERPLHLDRLLQMEEVVRTIAKEGGLLPFYEDTGYPMLSEDTWIMDGLFEDTGGWFDLHLSEQVRGKKKTLSVIVDYYSRAVVDLQQSGASLNSLRLAAQIFFDEFNGRVERLLKKAAARLGVDSLQIFYKMAEPSSRTEDLKDILSDHGYQKLNSPGWGSLPGKKMSGF